MSILSNRDRPDAWLREAPSGAINGINTTFTLSFTPVDAETLILFLDGVVLEKTTHYSLSGLTITMVTAPTVGQNLYATYRKA